jgi:ATP-binding cassette, subfamily C, bacteriocin exporter
MSKKVLQHTQKTFSRQHDQQDCGVACLLSVIRFYGGNATLERLRELSGTHTQGTTMLGLVHRRVLLWGCQQKAYKQI